MKTLRIEVFSIIFRNKYTLKTKPVGLGNALLHTAYRSNLAA